MADDVVDRLHKQTGLGITRVVVSRAEAREPLALPGVSTVAVIADLALSDQGLVEVLRARADRRPISAILLDPMDLTAAGWTDEAEEQRARATERVRTAIDRLQAAGIQARGEVLDGDAGEAARVAGAVHGADELLVIAVRGGGLASDDAQAAVREHAGALPMESIVVDTEAPASPSGSQG
jgi:hypothetical protein